MALTLRGASILDDNEARDGYNFFLGTKVRRSYFFLGDFSLSALLPATALSSLHV
jgi:hypothetical protein